MTSQRNHFDFTDHLVQFLDNSLRTLANNPAVTGRPNPAEGVEEPELDEKERKHVAGLMRINHCGEVCAQGLYQGQALTARTAEVREAMQESAEEENDHLDWTEKRLKDLNSHTSLLNPLFYAGSVAIGAVAGIAGDKWSLGFVAETERQVESHLDNHLQQLPRQDKKSQVILETMQADEIEHAKKAVNSGAAELPEAVKRVMGLTSKLMTRTTYYL